MASVCANMCGSNCGGICQECPTGVEIIEELKEHKKKEGYNNATKI